MRDRSRRLVVPIETDCVSARNLGMLATRQDPEEFYYLV
jgi:hypothetical protein